ncbi:ABC transporter permease [Meridianimarinicoccus sp. RP-17]|uniref:ABC transporter permease n=1 Tax=Meridianimarinicoccus zhengii TaxID=2056810 RepID=UPI000DABCF81|nr:ABC transporter permease [Phycocomes zhengii]
MADAIDTNTGTTRADRRAEAADTGPVLASDGTPLKASLRRALRAQKLRALMLVAPLLVFILVTFVAPIADMLFRSVENQIVSQTLPRTTAELQGWESDSGDLPSEDTYRALLTDLTLAVAANTHTRLGSRLNYEQSGMSSIFRQTGRNIDDVAAPYLDNFEALDPRWVEPGTLAALMTDPDYFAAARAWREENPVGPFGGGATYDQPIRLNPGIGELLPSAAAIFRDWAEYVRVENSAVVGDEEPWSLFYLRLYQDLLNVSEADLGAYDGPQSDLLLETKRMLDQFQPVSIRDRFIEVDAGWGNPDIWATIKVYSPSYTSGYFLNAVDMQLNAEGVSMQPEDERIYGILFKRTMFMSLMITGSCILLGYPIAWLLANLPMRTANLLMILVLLPFWTSLLVRTSAWKVMLQQQGVINDILVWLGVVGDESRLIMINNQFGTIVAMTHILLPFMILPLYSVMQTIPPSYLRAAKSLGATPFTAFWRVYFPQSVPGIGAGSILVFILAIGYYITPEIVGGTSGTFISNRIAYHISSSLNWGLAAALGSILLGAVLILYWAYDRIVGIDNVKLGG